jgi:hypothetical protein
VVNILTGPLGDTAATLAGHEDVNALDLTGVPADQVRDLEVLAADTLKRVFTHTQDWSADPGLKRLQAFLETRTIWHPVGI